MNTRDSMSGAGTSRWGPGHSWSGLKTFRRIPLLLALSFFTAGCELIGDIFQAGFVVGIIVIVVIVAVVWWIIGRFRGRG